MNEKTNFIFYIILISSFLFTITSCCTGRGFYYNGDGISKVRDNFNQLGKAETESAIRSEELEGKITQTLEGIRGSIEEIGRLEEIIGNGEGDIDEFKRIIRQIRKRNGNGN